MHMCILSFIIKEDKYKLLLKLGRGLGVFYSGSSLKQFTEFGRLLKVKHVPPVNAKTYSI